MAESASKIVRTMCPMNCHPTLCGMLAEVRDGGLVGVRGDPDNPDSQGFLCIRGQASAGVIGNRERLLVPQVRKSRTAPWQSASWDEAFERILAGMAAAAPEAVGIWPGHGIMTTNYGTRVGPQLLARFADFYGCQFWNPTMICWGLGAFGLGLTGLPETHTKEDMGANAELIILWAANLASQPNTARHLLAAKARGAEVIAIDVRHTEAAAKADEVLLVRPGSDAALALSLLHVIVAEGLVDHDFISRHTTGFAALASHLRRFTPEWAAGHTGVPAGQIEALARRYARTRPAMIVLGGSSMHKGANGWQAARAIACLPAITGNVGIPGGGLGPRHGAASHGRGLGSILAPERRARPQTIPNQMSAISAALQAGRISTLFMMGSNMLSSFADSTALARGLDATRLIVSYDLFLNETAKRYADVVLPATAWLEEVGCKMTNTHLYLMEEALPPPGQTRSLYRFIKELAERLGLVGFHPWSSEEAMVDAILDHPATGHASLASLRANAGRCAMLIGHVAHATLVFPTPSGRIEFYSEQAAELGLGPLPDWRAEESGRAGDANAADAADDAAGAGRADAADYPLTLAHGRTLAHFHAFYNNGRVLPALYRREPVPVLWIAPFDAAQRGVTDGAAVSLFNAHGGLWARARVTERIPAGTVWMRDGWPGLNQLTGGGAVLPDAAVDLFGFSAGQARFDAQVEVCRADSSDPAPATPPTTSSTTPYPSA